MDGVRYMKIQMGDVQSISHPTLFAPLLDDGGHAVAHYQHIPNLMYQI